MKKFFLFCSALMMSLSASAAITFGQAYSETDFNDNTTTVASDGDISWVNNDASGNGVRLGGSSTSILPGKPCYNYNDKYVIIALPSVGTPDSLSFTHRTNSSSATGAEWYVAASTNGSDFTNIWTTTNGSTSPSTVKVQIPEDARYLKLCYSGNFAGYFFNVIVTEYIEPEPEPTALEQTEQIGQGRKVLINGQIRIVRGNQIFDLTGARIR